MKRETQRRIAKAFRILNKSISHSKLVQRNNKEDCGTVTINQAEWTCPVCGKLGCDLDWTDKAHGK